MKVWMSLAGQGGGAAIIVLLAYILPWPLTLYDLGEIMSFL